jgi:RNA polymerase sigma-70 factor (ECF subfamily)
MGDATLRHDLPTLLEHSGWVRSLARRLASGADADDVEQAAWLAVLQSRAERGAPAREWFSAIVRNVARQQKRSAGRRADHETRSARPDELPSTVELLARAELQRRLVGAVMQLDEPYRTAVLLRYFENLLPRELAARLGVPVATVRTRLARALERLRERLDAEHGGERGAWIAAFVPLWESGSSTPSGLGALLLVNAKLVVACGVLCAAGAAWWWSARRAPEAAEVAELASPPSRPADASSSGHGSNGGANEPERVDVRSSPERGAANRATSANEIAATETATKSVSLALRGRVIDASGAPLGGVRLVANSHPGTDTDTDTGTNTNTNTNTDAKAVEVHSERDGSFSVEAAPKSGSLVSGSRNFATVLSGRFGASQRDDVVAVLAPRIDLGGAVVDFAGQPVEGAEIVLETPADLRARLRVVLDRAEPQRWSVLSNEAGHFTLEDAPQIDGARLHVTADGFSAWSALAPQFTELGLRVVLQRPLASDGFVRGLVVDPAGNPVHGAVVAFGLDTQRTPADGLFAFRIDDPESFGRRVGASASTLTAVARGWLPAEFRAPEQNGAPAWPAFVKLELGREALKLAGRVEDAKGEPRAGVRVYVADATLLGVVDERPALVETLFAAGEGAWKYVESDAAGRFELDGLLEREYVVRAHDPTTLLRVDSKPTRAGGGEVVLRLPTEALYPIVAGRVLTLSGTPVAGAQVRPMCDALAVKFQGRAISTSHDRIDGATTDEQGRFELRNVPQSLVYLRVDGERILPVEYGRYVEHDPRFADTQVRELPRERITELEIRVEARCHMQVELAHAEFADELAVLDVQGREVAISLFDANGRRDTERHPLHSGRSAMLSVPESGRTLVLFKAGVEAARSALELDPSQPTIVRR